MLPAREEGVLNTHYEQGIIESSWFSPLSAKEKVKWIRPEPQQSRS